jgi:hypothetical protein
MTDNINKNIENEELDLEQLENVSGGLNYDKLALADSKLMMGDKMMMGDMKLGLASGLASGLAADQAMGLADNAAILKGGKKNGVRRSLYDR